MTRLIDADQLKRYIDNCDFCDRCPDASPRCQIDCEMPDFLTKRWKRVIDEQPTVDAEPVRTGEWIATVSNEIHCSKCGCKPPKYWNDEHADYFTVLTNYCPNCGVLMYTEGI